MELLFATQNQHKIEEIRQMLKGKFLVKGLKDFGITDEVEETGDSFNENAFIKAKHALEKTGKVSIGDDSGLVIPALGGKPGIYSARYAKAHDFRANIEKVLHEMQNQTQRQAYMICVMCAATPSGEIYSEGKVYGTISTQPKGENGFGYDPIFIPQGYEQSFAQLPSTEKNKLSHRQSALIQLLQKLKKSNILTF